MKYCIGEFASILGVTADTLMLNKLNEIHKELRELESSLYTCKLK